MYHLKKLFNEDKDLNAVIASFHQSATHGSIQFLVRRFGKLLAIKEVYRSEFDHWYQPTVDELLRCLQTNENKPLGFPLCELRYFYFKTPTPSPRETQYFPTYYDYNKDFDILDNYQAYISL